MPIGDDDQNDSNGGSDSLPSGEELDTDEILEEIMDDEDGGEESDERRYELSIERTYSHSEGELGDSEPDYDGLKSPLELVAGDENSLGMQIQNTGESVFPGGEIVIDKVSYENHTLSNSGTWDIPELQPGESETTYKNIYIVGEGIVTFNVSVNPTDGEQVSVNGEDNDFFFLARSVPREDLLLMEKLDTIIEALEQ
ncbi:hypothetical protein [Halobacterium bonnevillei]|uniref:CARDB domain-containing protein n=1 Tax=Halobacterium bonnevillei TaxID=2692200 RepID=A0A6B0SFK2_9EURY|nr:hypothetical protein [Halobacterium bonnevillei]MXR19747.1 hypothetical protein [Halobacterium bonnevillei]